MLRPPGDPNDSWVRGVSLNVARDAITQRWIGSGGVEQARPPRQYDPGPYNWFDLWETATASYISITLNRQLLQPIGERFPPLASRVRSWSKQRLIDELSHNNGARDFVLAAELLKRDITNDELLNLLESRLRDGNDAVLSEVVAAHQVSHFEAAIRLYLRHDFLGYGRSTSGFRTMSDVDLDFTDVAMEVLRENWHAEGAFRYAASHGSPADCRELKDLPPLPPVFQPFRDAALRNMRSRLRLDEDGNPIPH